MLKRALSAAFILIVTGTIVQAQPAPAPLMPDHSLTPGAADPAVRQGNLDATICVPGYTRGVRHVDASTKQAVMAEYNTSREAGAIEIDHLIPLELGGSNNIHNLWPETRERVKYSAWNKDTLERRINIEVCAGHLSLSQGQAIFLGDWRPAYDRYYPGDGGTSVPGGSIPPPDTHAARVAVDGSPLDRSNELGRGPTARGRGNAMGGTVNWLLGAVKALLALMAVLLLVLVLWCIVSPFAYGLRWVLQQLGLDRFLASSRIARLTRRAFKWPGRTFRAVRGWFDGPLGHGSVRVVIDERLRLLKDRMISTRMSVQAACQTIDGLGGTNGPAVVTNEIRALQAKTEEIAKMGGPIDEDIAKDYQRKSQSVINLLFGIFFGTAFAVGNGGLLSQFLRSFITVYLLPGFPLAYLIAIGVVVVEMGLGWLVATSSFGEDAKRHLPLRWAILVAIVMIGLVESVIFGLLSYNFELDMPLFADHPWTRYWMAPFGMIFVTATTATGYMLHRSLDQLAERTGSGRLRRELLATNRFVSELPARWDRIAAKAHSAEAAIDSYAGALGGKDDALRGAIDKIRAERDALNSALAESHIDDWRQVAEAAEGDHRRDGALNVGLFILTSVVLAGFCVALELLLARAWPNGLLPGLAWWALATIVTFSLYGIGHLPFERLHYGTDSGRVSPLRTRPAEFALAVGVGVFCAIGFLWASVAAAGWTGLFIGVLFIAGAGIVALMGYFIERAVRGGMLAASVLGAMLATLFIGVIAIVTTLAAWLGFLLFWPIMIVLWFLGLPMHIALGWWQRRATQPVAAT